jgi:predicted TIM-barrel fold metal-dependent hydrolase
MSNGKTGPESPILPPLDFDPPSNGEFVPLPPTEAGWRRWQLWREIVEQQHRRLGLTRRAFAESACGVAAWLFAIQQIACDSGKGGAADAGPASDASGYDVQPSMMEDMAQAREALSGDEFVFDVQTHVVQPEKVWSGAPPDRILTFMKLIFVDSDTTVACLTGIPDTRADGIMGTEARDQIQQIVARTGGSRLLFHCSTNPELAGEADYMSMSASRYPNIAAWKSYPLNDPQGLAADSTVGTFLKSARDTGVKIIAAHRGIGGGGYASTNSPLDVVRAAKLAPDLKFLVYHSSWQVGVSEDHGYDPAAPADSLQGVDRFVRALEETKTPPNSNVYAELGTTWLNLLNRPAEAAHVLGKLLKYVGPDNVLYGTDCVMSGNPQPQIVAMRMLTIAPALQQQYGYPELTAELKRKILGLNGAKVYGIDPATTRFAIKDDDIMKLRMAYRDDPRSVPMPDRRHYRGPRTRQELFAFLRREQQAVGRPFG